MIPKLIIFDFDGTLVDTTAIILSTYQMTIRQLKADSRTDAQCQATIGLPLKEGFRQLYPSYDETKLDVCVDTYRRIFKENKASLVPKLYPGVRDTLDELERLNIQMAIASSRARQSLIEFCEDTDILKYFSLVVGADDVQHPKPNPEPVLITLKTLNQEAAHTLVVGDMPVDIAMGKGAGCLTAGVTYGNSSRADLTVACPSYILNSLPEILTRIINHKQYLP